MSRLIPFGKAQEVFSLITKSAAGLLTSADTLPTVTNVQIDGADADETAITIAAALDATPAPIAGVYNITVDLSATGLNLTANQTVSFTVTATIAAVITSATYSFTVADLAGQAPTVEIG